MKKQKGEVAILGIGILVIIGLVGLWMYIYPQWNVWSSTLKGEAELRRAEQAKLIMIETAKAEKQAAEHRAEAIQIMGAAAKEFPEYRQQEFMQAFGEALREGQISQVIYVPTEANLPILEAGQR